MSGRSAKRRRREEALAAQRQRSRGGRGRVPASSVRRATDRTARRRRQLLLSVGAAVVIAGVAIGVSQLRGSGSSKFAGTLKGKAAVLARFKGIPQQGLALGNPKAPVTVEYYADPQCPICRDFSVQALPTVVQRYVRPGKVRFIFRGQDFIGSDSERMLRLALAAARQNHLWQVIELGYFNQGGENSGWASEPLLRAIAAAVPGLKPNQVLSERQSSWVTSQITKSGAAFNATPLDAQGQHHTPFFMMGRTGSSLQAVDFSDLTTFESNLDNLLQ
ncbi:MAG: DsbA family protein [Gaiellaceae bacterium]